MSKKFKETKPDFSIVHDIAVAFASARIIDYKYPDDIDSNDLRQYRYANFLTDYAYVISQYQKAIENPTSDLASDRNTLNISVTLFDSILKLNSDLD